MTLSSAQFFAYVVADIVGESVGDWATYNICHELIEADDRWRLLERSLRTLLEKHPDMRSAETEIRGQLAQFHRLFFGNQTGPALVV